MNQVVGEEKGTQKKSSRVRLVSQANYQLIMLRCSIALWQDCSCGRKWNKNCSLPEQVEKYMIVDPFLIALPSRVDFANEDSLIRSCSDDECPDSPEILCSSQQKLWELDGDRVWSQHHKDKDYPEEVVKNYWANHWQGDDNIFTAWDLNMSLDG